MRLRDLGEAFGVLKPQGQLVERLGLGDAYFGPSTAGYTTFSFGGQTYTVPVSTTWGAQKAETIANSFEGYVVSGLMANSVVFSLASLRIRMFAEARMLWQRFNKGRPAGLYANADLSRIEEPWPGGTTGDLLAVMLLHADFAGNSYLVDADGEFVPLRPDWVDIMLGERSGRIGMEKAGFLYYPGGRQSGSDPVQFAPHEVCHFAPQRDPLAWYRGMSWLTPVIREIQADGMATTHKLKFFENAATPNLAVSLKEVEDPKQFEKLVDAMDSAHKGVDNAYKTLYLGAGADVTVIGQNMRDMDFSNVQGKGETRMASAAGVPPSVAGLSEGLQGAALNAGNFTAARRLFGETTLSPLWRNVAGSLQTLMPPPDSSSRLWYDTRDIPFLREDVKDLAEVQQQQAIAIRQLVEAGYEPDSVIAAITQNDWTLLTHTGLFSIQLQEAGSAKLPEPFAVTGTADNPPNSQAAATAEKKLAAQPPVPVLTPGPRTPAGAGNGSRP